MRSIVHRLMAVVAAVCVTRAGARVTGAMRPDIVIIMSDDMGWSDPGCYGGEIDTPRLDGLAARGLRFTQFYNTGRCCPTRASLLTGLYPHQAGVGHMNQDRSKTIGPGYSGQLHRHCPTLAEALRPAGYKSYALGKWHVARVETSDGPKHNWPLQRGFHRYYGTIAGGGNYFDPATLTRDNSMITAPSDQEYRPDRYYYTDAIADQAARFIDEHHRHHPDQPMLLYIAFTAAHWPLHAPPESVAAYAGRYDAGYVAVQRGRIDRQRSLGLPVIDGPLPAVPEFPDDTADRRWEARCMEVYAAQVSRMDAGIGRIVDSLQQADRLENTLLFYLQDNGACAESIERGERPQPAPSPAAAPFPNDRVALQVRPTRTRDGRPVRGGNGVLPGADDTFLSYGEAWATVSNTPLRGHKHQVHEGGISTPLIVHWPRGIEARGEWRHQPGHLIDIMATCLDVAGAKLPAEFNGAPTTPPEGRSLLPAFAGQALERDALYWEHEGNRAIRIGDHKLVAGRPAGKWELYNVAADRGESRNLAPSHPERVAEMAAGWERWAHRADVLPWPWTPAYGVPEPRRAGPHAIRIPPGSDRSGAQAPDIGRRAFSVTVPIREFMPDGVLVAQGGRAEGFAIFLRDGVPVFATRVGGRLTRAEAPAPLKQPATLTATLADSGALTLAVDGVVTARAQSPGLLNRQPVDGIQIGRDGGGAVGDYPAPFPFSGRIDPVTMELK